MSYDNVFGKISKKIFFVIKKTNNYSDLIKNRIFKTEKRLKTS